MMFVREDREKSLLPLLLHRPPSLLSLHQTSSQGIRGTRERERLRCKGTWRRRCSKGKKRAGVEKEMKGEERRREGGWTSRVLQTAGGKWASVYTAWNIDESVRHEEPAATTTTLQRRKNTRRRNGCREKTATLFLPDLENHDKSIFPSKLQRQSIFPQKLQRQSSRASFNYKSITSEQDSTRGQQTKRHLMDSLYNRYSLLTIMFLTTAKDNLCGKSHPPL